MTLGHWTKLMFVVTITALIYTNMQMQIVELAYKGKDKEKHIHELMDSNGVLTHQILSLKSANHLGQRLLEKEDGLHFMNHEQVMTISSPARTGQVQILEKPKVKAEGPIGVLLSWLTPQEATASDH